MGYDAALAKSWVELEQVDAKANESVRFLGDEYSVDLENKRVLSLSCNVPAKDYTTILVLHYLKKKIQGLPSIKEEWISFKQLDGGQGYYPIFKKRVIGPIVRKYGSKPEAILDVINRFKAKRVQLADVSLSIEVFDGVFVLVELYKGDEEFGPEVNVLFDESITDIFCTEDIVILSESLAHAL